MLPYAAGAQTYVSDYQVATYTSSFSSIAYTGTEVTFTESNYYTQQVTLPFTFPFGNETASTLTLGVYGQIGVGAVSLSGPGFYDHASDISIISPLAGNFYYYDPYFTPYRVYYETSGVAPNRMMVIEYNDRNDSLSELNLAFQVVLYETGDIEFVYDTCESFGTQVSYVFMREQGANRSLWMNGSWAAPTFGTSGTYTMFSPTSHPAPGLTFSFSREERNCLRPMNFICRSFSRPDSVCFTWNADPSTTMWEFRYDTIGTPVDSMTHVESYLTDTTYVCTTMVAGGVYEAYVRTDCGTEQSFWEGPVVVTPGAYNMSATGTNTIYACGGSIYDNGGQSGNYTNNCNSTLVVMPSSNDSLVTMEGTISTESCCDHLYIYDGVGTSGTLLHQAQGTASIPRISSISGPLTIRFTSDGSVVNTGFALQVSCIAAPECRTARNVTATHVVGTSAFIEWDVVGANAMPLYFTVRVVNRSNPSATVFEDTTSSNNYFLAGLTQLTDYTVYVISNCSESTIMGDSVLFTTHSLSGGTSLPSGTATLQTSGVPVMSSYGNSFCQSIYTVSELNAMGVTPGPINGVTYTWASAGSYNKDIVIFMGHTANASFATAAPLTGSMTQVYTGTRNIGDIGTQEYVFSTPFVWDGIHNIVLTSFVNQPATATHTSSGFNGYSTSSGHSNASIYAYKDNTPYTVGNLSSLTCYTSPNRPNVSFIMPEDTLVTCVQPNVLVREALSESVTLMWAPGYQETSWSIYFKSDADTLWSLAGSGITDHTYTIQSLSPQTNYTFKVVPDCGADSVYALVPVTTPCVPLTTLPFTEDFEAFTASSALGSPINQCWTRGTSNASSSYPYVTTSYSHSGTHSLYFYGPTNGYTYIALPAMGFSLDTLQVAFAFYKTSPNYDIKVGTMTDPTDYSSFQEISSVTPSAVSTWENVEVLLTGADTTARYIAFAAGGTSLSYIYLDDIEVSPIPTCVRPARVTVSNVTQTTATVRWSAPGINYFEIEYGPTGFAHGTGTVITSIVDSVTLYGLHHSTPYTVYVRGVCTSSDTSNWSFPVEFNTLCGEIDSLPFEIGFRNYRTGSGVKPLCWSTGGYSNLPYINDFTCTSQGSTRRSLYMYTYGSSVLFAQLPKLDSVSYPVNMVQTRFKAWTNTADGAPCIIGVCSVMGDPSSFTPVDTIQIGNEPAFYEASFEQAIGAGQYITFLSVSPAGATSNIYYLDSVIVELIPSCQTPNHFAIVNTTHNSVILDWNPRSTATQWQLEYGPHGFLFGTGTRVIANSNPFTINGLTPSTSYDYYIRTICAPGDTSAWSSTIGRFSTRQIPAAVPYFYDFETAAEWENWQTNSNTTINWYRDTMAGDGNTGYNHNNHYSMFISADSGSTYGTDLNRIVNVTAYRDIDFGPRDSTFTLSFRARAGGTPSAGYDALMVFLVDPDVPVRASDANITTPWGNVNDLTPLVTVRVSPNWNTYSVVLDTLSGTHRLAFFWFNQSTASTPFTGGPAAVDNIRIDYVQCPMPIDVHTTHLTMTTAEVAWYGPEDAQYYFMCRTNTGVPIAEERLNTNHIRLTDLTPNTTYNVYLRRICSSTDSSALSVGQSFTTKHCNETFFDTIGDLTSTISSYQVPVNNYYRYSYSQQIIPASELDGAGSITAINFSYASASPMTSKTNCTIYMGHTARTSFPVADSIVNPRDLQLVYTGSLNCAQGWNRFVLDYPFEYDGVSNIVIAIDDNSGQYNGAAAYSFNVTSTTAASSLSFYHDSYNPDATSYASLMSFTGSKNAYAYRANVAFEYCPPTSCMQPVLRAPLIRPETVTIRWRNTGSSYILGYRLASTASWITTNIVTTDTFYVIHNVIPYTEYVYQVRQVCDSTGISNWQVGSFNSGDIPCLTPSGLEVSSVTNNRVDLRWQPESNNLSYRVHVFNSYFDKYVNTYVARKVVTGLDANMTYYAAVQASCQDIDDPSEWSDTITFTTDFCPDATDLTYSDLQGNSVVLDWVEGGRATQWEIQYGTPGFDQGSGFSVIADSHPYTLNTLIGETEYEILVRAICDDNFYSEHWSNSIIITTPYSAIDGPDGGQSPIHLAPNPTSADVTLTLPATTGNIQVQVIDHTGRTHFALTLPAGTTRAQLPASRLSAGAYFVRVTADNLNAIKKLIVR